MTPRLRNGLTDRPYKSRGTVPRVVAVMRDRVGVSTLSVVVLLGVVGGRGGPQTTAPTPRPCVYGGWGNVTRVQMRVELSRVGGKGPRRVEWKSLSHHYDYLPKKTHHRHDRGVAAKAGPTGGRHSDKGRPWGNHRRQGFFIWVVNLPESWRRSSLALWMSNGDRPQNHFPIEFL